MLSYSRVHGASNCELLYNADASNKRKYNTVPLSKLQTISDDEESGPSDYEKMNEGCHRDVDYSTPLSRIDHTPGDIT